MDPEYIDQVYAGSIKIRDKYKWVNRYTNPMSVVATIPHELHRIRRASLNNYFSKASIRRLEPMVRDVVAQLLTRMDVCGKSREVMSMNMIFKALTSDIITRYSFGKSTNFVTREDYNRAYFGTTDHLLDFIHWFFQIGWLSSFLSSLPIAITIRLMPGLACLFKLRLEWKCQIEEIKRSKGSKTDQENIFYGLLESDLPESEKAISRLLQEAEIIIQAGQDTTASTLSAITYQLLANPEKLSKLKKELADAIPDSTNPPTCKQVENLPYLSAVIQEVLRLHPGATFRSQRVSPNEPLHYDDGINPTWIIPAGTPMSSCVFSINRDPNIFPEPNEFRPERWLDNPRLDRYLFTFSKGTRICLGINLAYQELYLVTAAIFRKYNLYDGTGLQQGPTLALYETTRERDVDMKADLAMAVSARGSKGVRVLVRS
ncbi:hypothetical protein MMC22_005952 [Lobaria immixta]|nr:hypothetical protein [Lobaria immixta]